MKKLLLLLSFVYATQINAQYLIDITGNGNYNYAGDGGPAINAEFRGARGVAVDPSGNIYFTDADNNRIRKINTWGIITTFAGNGYGIPNGGFSGDGGQATDAELWDPTGIAADAVGNIFFTDYANHRVRKVNTAGIITTVAGNGYGGFGGDGGQATNASLYYPSAIDFDTQGNMYIADEANYRIRKVTTAGIITTICGNGTAGFTGDNGPAASAEINDPMGITVDVGSNIYFTDRATSRLRRISNTGIITTIAGTGSLTFNGDNIPSTSANLNQPIGLCHDAAGNIYCVNYGYNRVRKIAGTITTVIGNGFGAYGAPGAIATSNSILNPKAVTFDNAGRLLLADEGNMRIRIVTLPITVTANSATMCANNPATLTTSGADTYNWYPTTGLSSDTGASVSASPTVTTTYTVTGTKNNTLYGVSAPSLGTAVVTVVVNATPTINLAGNTFSICNGSSQTFTASSASSYTWTPAATLDNPNIASPTASPTTTTIYNVTSAAANGCTTLQTVTLTVIPIPTLSVTSNSYTICAGNSATLTASGSNTYTWAPATNLNNVNLASPIVSPTTTTVYTVGSTNACGVSTPQTVTVNVNVNTLPTITIAANHDTICAGQQTATLTASGASSYTWSTGAASAIISPSPTVTTNYFVTGSDVNGCTNTDSVKVIVNPLPTINVSSGIVCSATSTTICASGASTYTWLPSNHIGSCLTTSVNATYTIQGTDVNGCINTKIKTAQVVSNPTVSVYGNVTTVCTQTCAAFYSNVSPSPNGVTYQWNFGDGVTQPVGSATECYAYTNPNASYTVSLTATDANGCKSTAKTTITVNPTPTVAISLVGYTSSICLSTCTTANPSFTPSSTSVSTYTWDLDYYGQLTNVSNGYYCSTHSGLSVITLTVTDVNGCIGIGTKSITVNPTPTVNISAAPLSCSSLCEAFTSTVSTPSVSTYAWAYGDGVSASTTANPSHCYSNTITAVASLTVTDVNGCVGTATTNVRVNPLPSAITATVSNNPICAGTSAVISHSGASTYSLFPTNQVSANNFTVTPTTTTTYTLIGSNGVAGCTDTVTTSITVNPTPTLSINPNNVICPGGTNTLCVNGATTYTWIPSNYVGNCLAINASGNYTIQGTDANGCISTTSTYIQTVGNPTINISAAALNCNSLCDVFMPSITSGTIISTYLWDFGDGGPRAGVQNPSYCYAVPGSYSVSLTVTDANGCIDSVTKVVFVNPGLNLSVQSTNASCNALCNGSAMVNASGGASPYSFVWTPASGVVTNTSVTSTQNNLCAGTYSCIATDINACADTIAINITEPPALTLTINQTNASCSGMCDGTATLTVSGGTPAYMYSWAGLGNQPVTTGVCAGTYTCNVTDFNGCKDSITTTIAQPTPIVVTYTLMQDTAPHVWDVYPTYTGGIQPYTYSWNWGDLSTSGTAYPSHTYAVAGNYSICVMVTDANGCSSTYCQNDSVYRLGSNSTMITVNVINGAVPTGIKNISAKNDVNIYPNPNNGTFIIEANNSNKLIVQIFDVNGRLVLNQIITGKTIINANDLLGGLYNISISSSDGVVNKRLVIVK